MSYHEFAGILAAFVGVCAFVPYIFAIFGRNMSLGRIQPTKPEIVTWTIWLVLGSELLLMNYLVGARESLPLLVAYAVAYLVIAILSIRYGTGSWTPLNKLCLFGGLAAAAAWGVLKGISMHYGFVQSEWAEAAGVGLAGVADIAAFLPTIGHVWNQPHEENRTGWTLGFLGAVFNLFAITYSLDLVGFTVAAFPVYNAFLMGVIVLVAWVRPIGLRRRALRSA